MINKYLAGKQELKSYFVSKVTQGTAKNGSPYTRCQIADVKEVDGQKKYTNYTVFSWQPNLRLRDGDKLTFQEIKSIEIEESEYNGKPVMNRVIFADINVIEKEPNKVDIVGEMPALEPIDSSELPF